MARFYGKVGYAETVEDPVGSGVFVDNITEAAYFGDVVRNSISFESGEKLNVDLRISNAISIVADEYAIAHAFAIRYVEWEGVLWSVTNVEIRAPRLTLTLGSVYNGPTPIV